MLCWTGSRSIILSKMLKHSTEKAGLAKTAGETIAAFGEKRLIQEVVKPLFNPYDDPRGVGDDCGFVDSNDGNTWLFSTDRVPADLISFRLGILDFYGLGGYLVRLNLSDIAACGGRPTGLLLNLGLPSELQFADFVALCAGARDTAEHFGCRVLGGDLSSSKELSISATSIGVAPQGKVLTRRSAREGDLVFISRPLGLTPAAFAYFLRLGEGSIRLAKKDVDILRRQFTSIGPMVELGRSLSDSGYCTACMDNTDGIGQSLAELGAASGVAIVIERSRVQIPRTVAKVAAAIDEDPFSLAFSAGADFSLVGTLSGGIDPSLVTQRFDTLEVIGVVEAGAGVHVKSESGCAPLQFTGWNYFDPS
jgi:thiamine-monophosphate kinase